MESLESIVRVIGGAGAVVIVVLLHGALPALGQGVEKGGLSPGADVNVDGWRGGEEWAGSILLEAIGTRVKVGGSLELNVIHDHGKIATPVDFVTAAIVTGNDVNSGVPDRRTSVSMNTTLLTLESRTPIWDGQIKTFTSADFFGESESRSPHLQLRQLYGELSDNVFEGDLLVGKAWTTFADVEAWPNTLDFEGPSSSLQTRHFIVRWTRELVEGARMQVALEKPDNHDVVFAESLNRWPDLVVATVWKEEGHHLKGAMVWRDLRASGRGGRMDRAMGWGFAGSGKLSPSLIPERDVVTFSIAGGSGIGSFFDDEPPDAIFDSSTGRLEALSSIGYFTGYEHVWAERWRSTVSFGAVRVNTSPLQPVDAYRKARYFSANLIWEPVARWQMGVEFLRGKRVDKNGADGTDSRVQFTTRFSF